MNSVKFFVTYFECTSLQIFEKKKNLKALMELPLNSLQRMLDFINSQYENINIL